VSIQSLESMESLSIRTGDATDGEDSTDSAFLRSGRYRYRLALGAWRLAVCNRRQLLPACCSLPPAPCVY
jgi:hypothetical protein